MCYFLVLCEIVMIAHSVIHSVALNPRRTRHSRSGLLTFLTELWSDLDLILFVILL